MALAAVNRSQTYSPKLEYGIINTKGKIIVPFEYDYIGTPTNYGYAQAEKDGKKGIIL